MSARSRLPVPCASLLCAWLALTTCGCQWLQRRTPLEPTPIQFQQPPTLEQLISAVNGNTERVSTLKTRDARLTIKGVPASVSLNLTYEQPRRLRLQAGTVITGQELDLGSNDELFWFWARQNPQPALLFARHDQFARSPNRNLLPIEPLWIIDAMGLPRFDPAHRHEGPLARGNGLLEIRSHIPTPNGENTKLTVINQQYAWVVQQQVYDPRGRLLASAQASEHEFFPQARVALPRKVAIELAGAQLSFTVETVSYSLNFPVEESFALPRAEFPNVPLVDLGDPALAPQATTESQPSNVPPGYPTANETPRVRGLR